MSNAKRSFVIGDQHAAFIDAQVTDGRYNNASEVVRAGLRLLEDHEAQLRQVREAIDAADAEIARGEGVMVSSAMELAAAVRKSARGG